MEGENIKELISIIIPVYRVEEYINKCIDSVLAQTYKKLEIILVDDGSPDNCGEICDKYAEEDKRIKVIHKENGGLSDARNHGIDESSGQYITFLDSDDWIHPQFVEKMYSIMQQTDSDITICDYFNVTDEILDSQTQTPALFTYSNVEALEQLNMEYSTQFIVAWGKLYSRELFSNIRYDKGRIHEDEFTTPKLLYAARRIAYTTEKLVYYRHRKESITNIYKGVISKRIAAEALKERAEFYRERGLIKLSDKACMDSFLAYRKVIYDYKKTGNKEMLREALEAAKELKPFVHAGEFKIKIKIFLEMYFLLPGIMDHIFRFTKKMKRKRGV